MKYLVRVINVATEANDKVQGAERVQHWLVGKEGKLMADNSFNRNYMRMFFSYSRRQDAVRRLLIEEKMQKESTYQKHWWETFCEIIEVGG